MKKDFCILINQDFYTPLVNTDRVEKPKYKPLPLRWEGNLFTVPQNALEGRGEIPQSPPSSLLFLDTQLYSLEMLTRRLLTLSSEESTSLQQARIDHLIQPLRVFWLGCLDCDKYCMLAFLSAHHTYC